MITELLNLNKSDTVLVLLNVGDVENGDKAAEICIEMKKNLEKIFCCNEISVFPVWANPIGDLNIIVVQN